MVPADDSRGSQTSPRTNRREFLAGLAASSVAARWEGEDGVDGRWGSRQIDLVGDDAADRFGAALTLDGETALVGAAGTETVETLPTGAAFLYARDGDSWRRTTLSPGADGDRFGESVALDGPTALVGDPLARTVDGALAGAVSVFDRTDGAWDRTATLAPADPTGADRFGSAIALDGRTAVVGAKAAGDGEDRTRGRASVFTRSDGEWSLESRLQPGTPVRRFGSAVDVDGDIAVVGGLDREPGDVPSGSAFVFDRSDGSWSRRARLVPGADDAGGFGTTLALDGETVVAGAPGETTADGYRSGAAYVFTRSETGWHRRARLRAPDGRSDDRFGSAVAIDGDTAVVVATAVRARDGADSPAGAAHVFTRRDGRWRWDGTQPTDADGPPRRATDAAVDEAGVLVGARPVEGPDGDHGGTVRVVRR